MAIVWILLVAAVFHCDRGTQGWRTTSLATRPTSSQSTRLFANHHKNQQPTIARLAVRQYAGADSKPSGRNYTTRKDSVESCQLTTRGPSGDYNHYRTVALANTTDRAVSLWTADCAAWLQQQGWPVQAGDLGENFFLAHVAFDDLHVGRRLRVVGNTTPVVVLQITEPIVPCANLCKLPYINDPAKSPKQRIQACQDFLEQLDQAPGLRGWYAKVLTAGSVRVQDVVEFMTDEDE